MENSHISPLSKLDDQMADSDKERNSNVAKMEVPWVGLTIMRGCTIGYTVFSICIALYVILFSGMILSGSLSSSCRHVPWPILLVQYVLASLWAVCEIIQGPRLCPWYFQACKSLSPAISVWTYSPCTVWFYGELGDFHLHPSVPSGRSRACVGKNGSDLGVQEVDPHAACYLDPCILAMRQKPCMHPHGPPHFRAVLCSHCDYNAFIIYVWLRKKYEGFPYF